MVPNIAPLLGFLLLAQASEPGGISDTGCSFATVQRYGYGPKAKLTILVPTEQAETLTTQIKAFAAKNGLSYSAADFTDPSKSPIYRSVDHTLQSKSSDVSINIDTNNRSPVAHVWVATFSSSCQEAEDWRPYWQAFTAFLRAAHYRVISN